MMTVLGIGQTSVLFVHSGRIGTRIEVRLNIEVGGEWLLRKLRIALDNLAPGLQHSRSLLSQLNQLTL